MNFLYLFVFILLSKTIPDFKPEKFIFLMLKSHRKDMEVKAVRKNAKNHH